MTRLSSFCVCFTLAVAVPIALPAQTPTFSQPKQVAPGAYTLYLGGNFNGNGNTDLIVNPYSTWEFLTGDGHGNFSQTGPISTLPIQNAALVADVNGDGKDDIITLLAGCEENPCSNYPNDEGDADGIFTVMLSHGNGTFTQGYVGTLPPGLGSVEGVVGDFNKDGKPDIAVLAFAGGYGYYTAPAVLSIFINQGNGTFTQTDYQTPDILGGNVAIGNLVIGDFEGNGNQDIALLASDLEGYYGFNPHILTFAGDGKGNFGPGVISYSFDSSSVHYSLFAADLNHDGRTDLLTALEARSPYQATGNWRIPSLLANTSGRFYWHSAVYVTRAVGSPSILLDDFNGDGNPDLFYVGNLLSTQTQQVQSGIYLGLGNGAFKTPHIPLNFTGIDYSPTVFSIHLKTGDLPSLLVEDPTGQSVPMELLINTTTR